MSTKTKTTEKNCLALKKAHLSSFEEERWKYFFTPVDAVSHLQLSRVHVNMLSWSKKELSVMQDVISWILNHELKNFQYVNIFCIFRCFNCLDTNLMRVSTDFFFWSGLGALIMVIGVKSLPSFAVCTEVAMSSAALSHRKLASAGTSHDSCSTQGHCVF